MTSHKKAIKYTLFLLAVILSGFISITLSVFFHPKIIIYSAQQTYTMADDGEVYLMRFPMLWVEENYVSAIFPPEPPVFKQVSEFKPGIPTVAYIDRYNWHVNVDFTVRSEGDQLILTYTGYGKLPDGTTETIDETFTSPAFPYTDYTEGLWEPPLEPGETRPPDILNNPNYVFDPK